VTKPAPPPALDRDGVIEGCAVKLDDAVRKWRDTSEQAGNRGHHPVFVQAGNVADALAKEAAAIRAMKNKE
jgi:hypothetical protein